MKKRRIMALITAAAMAMGLAGCGGGSAATATTAAPAETEKTTEAAVTEAAAAAKSEGSDNWKVAILTGTVSQGEEEFRAAERALETYGPEHIVTATYPDNFMSEMETTVSQIVSFASDPDVKAIVMCQAVPGAKAGFDKVREIRPLSQQHLTSYCTQMRLHRATPSWRNAQSGASMYSYIIPSRATWLWS